MTALLTGLADAVVSGVAGATFGPGPLAVQVAHARPGRADTALVRERLSRLVEQGPATLQLAEPLPTAAFSRRDLLLPGYAAAEQVVVDHGYAPIVRPVGGHLAVYGAGDLVVHHWARHPSPRDGVRARFALFGEAVAGALRSLGVDARVGPVPGEYCDGEFSVNEAGRTKLVGTGQRIVRSGYLVSAAVMVHSPEPARAALTAAYDALGLPFDPRTVGCVADSVPGITVPEVRDALTRALVGVLRDGRPVDGAV